MKRAGSSTAFGASLELEHNIEARSLASEGPPTAPRIYPLQAPLSGEAALRNSQVLTGWCLLHPRSFSAIL